MRRRVPTLGLKTQDYQGLLVDSSPLASLFPSPLSLAHQSRVRSPRPREDAALTESLSENNFFMPIVEKYDLMGRGVIKEEEIAALKRVRLDENGARACSMFEVWAFEIISGEASRSAKTGGHVSPPIHASLLHVVNEIGACIKRLFAYRYQVLPVLAWLGLLTWLPWLGFCDLT